jgi:hypothetical protein
MIKMETKRFVNLLTNRAVLFLIPMILLAITANTAYAQHEAIVTISPDIANCEELGNIFTVNVENNATSQNDLLQVEIYKALAGISDFTCGPAPLGWNYLPWPGEDRCIYVTGLYSPDKIAPGENLDFTFEATMSSDACQSDFIVVTVDDAYPQGDRDTNLVNVLIDCTDPTLYKYLDGPYVGDCPDGSYIDHGDCWVQDHGTWIMPQVYDDEDQCDLGLDFCTYRIWLDGNLTFEHTFDPADPTTGIGWEFVFEEDTVHILEIVCEDIAGNILEHNETFFVDSQAPITWKDFGEPYKAWYPELGIAPEDWHDCYQYGQHYCKSMCMEVAGPEFYYDCLDECLYVDVYGECGFYMQWITSNTPVYLEAFDEPDAPCAVEGVETYWRNTLVADWWCYEGCPSPGGGYQVWEWCDWCYDYPEDPECIGAFELCSLYHEEPMWNPYVGEFYKPEESCHLIEYYSVDELGNEELVEWQCVFVDNTPPLSVKTHGTPIVYDEGFDWVTQETTITLDCDDSRLGEAPHPVGQETLCYKVSFDQDEFGEPLPEGQWNYLTLDYCTEFGGFYDIETGYCCAYMGDDVMQTDYELHFMEDSYHNLEYYCVDHLGNDERDYNIEYPPCAPTTEDGAWIQWYRVDTVSPWIEKYMFGEYLGDCPEGTDLEHGDCYVADNGLSGVDIYVYDGGDICAVDDMYCEYYVWWEIDEVTCRDHKGMYDSGWCLIDSGIFSDYQRIIFGEDSTHILEVYCWDALGNYFYDEEEFLVDSTPPDSWKWFDEDPFMDWYPKGCYEQNEGYCAEFCEMEICRFVDPSEFEMCMYECVDHCISEYCGWAEWITPENGIYLDAVDNKVGVDKIWYMNVIDITEMSCTNPQLYCQPAYTLYDEYGRPFPASPYEHADPGCIDFCQDDCEFYVDYGYKSWEDCVEDCAHEGCGVDPLWQLWDGNPIYKDESCHVLQWFSVDYLNNIEDFNVNCFFVDDTAPEVWKIVGEPQVFKNDNYYISGETPITMYCEDIGPHPVDHVSLWYRYRISEDCENWGEWEDPATYCSGDYEGDWCDPANPYQVEKTIYFPEDCCHELEYYCVDGLGHETEHYFEIDIVDSQPPVIETEIIGPWYWDGEDMYIDGVTEIYVEAWDPDPHPVNDVVCDWYYYVNGEGPIYGGVELTPPFYVSFPEECYHELYIECWDALGNYASVYEEYLVDKTPPWINKSYGEPYFENDYEYINSETLVHIDAGDDGQHPSGLAELWYSVSLVDDVYCYEACRDAPSGDNWVEYEGPFTIPEDSCHLIEIWAIDNVDKENYHRQCVFVDNQGPDPIKTVGEPKLEWDGLDAYYYDLDEFCATPGNCWKITTTTPIKMECEDPDPHPVDHEYVCFKVELDADDYTSNYCDYYQGSMGDDGYCCVDDMVEVFYFYEESEHNLDFYCVDALGNKGEHDDEKFKVGGGKFRLDLCKKWNLISVPFVLLDNDVEAVFGDVAEEVMAVWSYNNGEWFVWTPGPAPDSLETIDPGYGYWVLMDGCVEIVLGGSLLSEGPNNPPGRDLEDGWNLIGYYGATSMYENHFQIENGNCYEDCDMFWEDYGYDSYDECVFEECGYWYGEEPVYCALNSLVDTQQGFPRWSALWGYFHECVEECNTQGYWYGLDACCNSDYGYTWCPDYMEAGQGYWIEMDIEDYYTPATNCIWNEDMTCVNGGIIC